METLFLISCTILACLTPVWYASGRVAQGLLGVPSITGILAAGLLAGPHALGLLRPHHLALLHSSRVEGVCLSYIALLAGTELKAGDVQRTRRLVFTLVLSISLASWAAVALGFWTLKNYLPLFSGLSWYEIVAVSNMLGVLAIARSPAAAISVLKETKANGPFTSTVMAVVLAKDIMLFVAFAAAFGIMKQVITDVNNGVDTLIDDADKGIDHSMAKTILKSLGLPALEILTSIVVGSLAGLGLASPYFVFPRLSALHQRRTLTNVTIPQQQAQQAQLQHQQGQQPLQLLKYMHRVVLVESPRLVFPVLAAAGLRYVADAFGTEVLLTCVSAGVTLGHLSPPVHRTPSNITSPTSLNPHSNVAHASLFNWSGALPVISTIFFGLVGANLQVDKIGRNVGPAFLFFGLRLAGVWAGCFVGGRVGGGGLVGSSALLTIQRKYLWMTMITQAGIALGLTRTVISRYPTSPWAADFEALMAGQVIVNLIAGPPALRHALRLAGETASELDGLEDSIRSSSALPPQHRDGIEITMRPLQK